MRVLAAAWIAIFAVASVAPAVAQSQPMVLTPDGNSQDNSVIAVPPAPPIVASPASPPMPAAPAAPAPPGLVQISPPSTGDAGGNTDNGDADNASAPDGDNSGSASGGSSPGGATAGQIDAAQNQLQDQDTIPTPPNAWQPGTTAEIGVLDKVGGGVKEISVPVGGQTTVGDLQVNVLACVTRPPNQVPDAAVFVALQNTDTPSGPPNYRGWLVRSEPGAAVAGDASEMFRVIDCS